jgi:penicillin V acylase-like amidase (Ntn superfamily)
MKAKYYLVLVVFIALLTGFRIGLPVSAPSNGNLVEAESGQGCTSFCLDNGDHCVFGTNFDNEIYEGLIFVNPRGLSKTGWEESSTGEVAHWIAKYSSISFDLVGYQLVWAGMNEAGLMLSTMALGESVAPPVGKQPPLATPLWLQYLLDNYATIDEVVASQEVVSIARTVGRPVDHYLICDGRGDCVVFEFLAGKVVVHKGGRLPVASLTNSRYQDSITAWEEQQITDNSLSRFAIAADRVKVFTPGEAQTAVDYAFETLAEVSNPGWTQWSIVFDPHNLRVYYRTKENPTIRSLDFNQLDFTCGGAIPMLDVHADLAGDISTEFGVYDHDINLDHMVNVMNKLGLTAYDDQLEPLVTQIENFPCVQVVTQPDLPTGSQSENPAETQDIPWVLVTLIGSALVVLILVMVLVVVMVVRRNR